MKDIDTLLSEYFHGSLDKASQQKVESWIQESPENRETARRICRLEQYVEEYRLLKTQDRTKLLKMAERNTSGRCMPWRLAFRIAASIVVIAAIGLLAYSRYENMQPQMLTFATERGEVASVVLPDKTTVWLNSNSVINYPAEFSRRTREVYLEGEAYFDVTKDEKHPFIVKTQNYQIKVLGTEFDVNAYSDSASGFYTTLVSGSVEMTMTDGNSHRPTVLLPGQRLSYNAENDKVSVSYVDTESLTSWRTGRITFCHAPLKEVLMMIGNTFGVRFVINNMSVIDCTYTGSFDNQSLENILFTLEQIADIHFKPLRQDDEVSYPRYIVY